MSCSTKTLGSDISLPSKPCRTTAHLANKAYASDGEAASALHAIAGLQVFQAKLLQAAEGGALTAEATKDLRAATDFALMATKRAAQAVGKAMGFMVVLQRHLWLNLADLKEADRKVLLNAPVTPSGLFGDAVESITERFAEARESHESRDAETRLPAADGEIQIFVGAWLFPAEGYSQASACGGDCYCSSTGTRCPEESVGSR